MGLIEWVNQLIGFPTLAIAVVPCTVLRMRLMFDAMLSYIAILSVFYCVDLFFCGPPSSQKMRRSPLLELGTEPERICMEFQGVWFDRTVDWVQWGEGKKTVPRSVHW